MGVSFVRTVIVFLLLIVAIRIMGKRQLGELEPLELVTAVLISNLAAQPLQDTGTPLIYGIVPVLTLLCSQLVISGISVKYGRFRALISGKPSILVDNGVIVQSEMKKCRISVDELYVELRINGVTDISNVRHAILETDGTLSVLPYAKFSAVTPDEMNLDAPDNGLPVTVVNEGRIMSDNLKLLNHDGKWLADQIKKRGAKSVRDVYLMTVDAAGKIYYAEKEGKR